LKDHAAVNCVSGAVVNQVKKYLYHYSNGRPQHKACFPV
jgi:hypothetical protein